MDYGARVAQKGYDTNTCPDDKLVFSSSFQTLKIYSVQTATTTIPGLGGGTNTITMNHNLGYYPPYIVVYNGRTQTGLSQSYFFSDSNLSALVTRMTTSQLQIDIDTYFDFTIGDNTGDTVYFTVYIFLDDFRTVSEKNIITGTVSPGSHGDYGIRVSKEGYDVKTCTDEQLSFSSSFYNQLIHKKGTVSGVAATVSHNLGYIPNFLFYYRPSGQTYITYDPIVGQITSSDLLSGLSSGYTGYYVIFKNNLT